MKTMGGVVFMSVFLWVGFGGVLCGQDGVPAAVSDLRAKLAAKRVEYRQGLVVQLEALKESRAKAENFVAVGEAHTLIEIYSGESGEVEEEPADEGLKKLISAYRVKMEKIDGIYRVELLKMARTAKRNGESAASRKLEKLVEAFDLERSRDAPMAEIKVKASVKVSVEKLVKGVARLSGGYRPGIDHVDAKLEGREFLRVPWQSKPTFLIEAVEEGNVYVMNRAPNNPEGLMGLNRASDPEEGLLKGAWLEGAIFHRVYLKRGDVLQVSAAGGTVIARKIKVL